MKKRGKREEEDSDSEGEEEKQDRGYPRHLPWKFGEWIPWWNVFYILDYIAILFLVLLLVLELIFWKPSTAFLDRLHTYPKEYVATYYNYPHDDELWETGPTLAVIVAAPIVFIFISQIWVLSLHDLHNALLGYATTILLNQVVLEGMKNLFGFLRPDIIERLEDYDDDDGEYYDGMKSFPSGHAASVMCVYFYLALYFNGKMRPYFEGSGDGFLFLYFLIITGPLFAIYLSITRITEYQHFITDVIAGWFIGILIAFSVYCLFYFPPFHPQDGLPKVKKANNLQAVFYRKCKHMTCCGCIRKRKDEDE